ncbi:MAG: NusG domain II-containing protein [Acidobacteriota bacterium]
MDRRDFLKWIVSSSLIPPLLGETESAGAGFALYFIGERPQLALPLVLDELRRKGWVGGEDFGFSGDHPFSQELRTALAGHGWRWNPQPASAGLSLSYQLLRRPASPSFALVEEGRVRDLRAERLARLWLEINSRQSPSACLTVASLRPPRALLPGKSAAVYVEGKKRASFSLAQDRVKRWPTKNGEVVVGIESGRAVILSSECRHKICQSAAPAGFAGERLICAPNHFLLEIEGPRLVDTVTG